jgi:Uma2 family endonuclease
MSVKARLSGSTYEDYCHFPDDGRRHELIGGEHYVTPAPSTRHQRIVIKLARLIDAHASEYGLGMVLVAPTDVILSDTDVVQPDVLFVATAHLGRVAEHGVLGAPDLTIEILSQATRRVDEVEKRKLYEAAGVAEYWVVDPELEIVKIYRASNGRYARVAELSREEAGIITSPLFPGLDLPLAAVFA